MGQAYSLQEAADKAGVSKSTIYRLTKREENPLSKNDQGKIDPSELARIFPAAFSSETSGTFRETFHGTRRHGSETVEISSENAVLQVKLEAAQKLADEREQELHHRDVTITDLRTRLDQSEQKRDEAQTKLTALLTDQREKAPQEAIQRRWWPWLAAVAVLLAIALAVVLLRPETVTAMVANLT